VPLQKGQLGTEAWFFDPQRRQNLGVFLVNRRESDHRLRVIDNHLMVLDARQLIDCALGRERSITAAQFHLSTRNLRSILTKDW
jgi:hypothetical protein